MEAVKKNLTQLLDEFGDYTRQFPVELGKESQHFAQFKGRFEKFLSQGEAICQGLDRRETRKVQQHSWAHPLHGTYLQAPVNWRAFHKPRGYAGDGELLDMFHRANYEGETGIGRLIHRVSMLQPAAQAVRNRANLVRAGIEETLYSHSTQARILSMGCGTSPELKSLVADHPYYESPDWQWLGLDVDDETVAMARLRHQDPRLTFGLLNAFELSRNPEAWNLGKFDFIYAVGLFDYFPLGTSQNLTALMFRHLNPGGKLWIGNFHPNNRTRWYMEYISKWHLIHRTDEDLKAFADRLDLPVKSSRIFFESSHSQIFLELMREG